MMAGFTATFLLALKRLYAQRSLTLALGLGLTIVVGFTLSIPLYADAVYFRVFSQELESAAEAGLKRPPFSIQFWYEGAWSGAEQWETITAADAYLTTQAEAVLGLPQQLAVRHFRTATLKLSPTNAAANATTLAANADSLGAMRLAFMSDFESHVTVLAGRTIEDSAPGEPIEALVSETLAAKLNLRVGDTYLAWHQSEREGRAIAQLPVRVVGLWRAQDATEVYWCCPLAGLDDLFFISETAFRDQLSPALDDEIYFALWYVVMDASEVNTADAGPLATRLTGFWQHAAGLLPNTRLALSPLEALQNYQQTAATLTLSLYAYSLPIFGLMLAFILLVVRLMLEHQRGELAVLRSRGASVWQIAGLAVWEGCALGAFGLGLGWPLAHLTARWMGAARGFFNFSAPVELRVTATLPMLWLGFVAVGVTVVAYVGPALAAARQTIVTFKQERARSLRAPGWQRMWLDGLLLIPAGYGLYLLRQQGRLTLPGESVAGDPFQNPLLFFIPTLASLALTLLVLRLTAPLTAAAAWMLSRTRSVGLLLAARQLARMPGFYAPPLALLVLTLSLSIYTASLAQTVDKHLEAQVRYAVGSDLVIREQGLWVGGPAGSAGDDGQRWQFPPVAEHRQIPGVRAAARVGRYLAFSNLSGAEQTGLFLGLDPADFPPAAFWRNDFAPDSLSALMRTLAREPAGVLVPRAFLAQHALQIGTPLRVLVDLEGQTFALDVTVAGVVDLFPGWYPQDGPLFVGNLAYLFEQAGSPFPHDVWLQLDETLTDYQPILAGVRALGITPLRWEATAPRMVEAQRQPERQGLLGLLSVGFAAAALLAVVGFLLYALFSFRRRFVELGVLRAIGLTTRQMSIFLAGELGMLIGVGVAAGTGIGLWLSHEFIPRLQVGAEPLALLPPFVIVIAWPVIQRIYALFGLLFIAALAMLVARLRHLRLFEAVKMGEST